MQLFKYSLLILVFISSTLIGKYLSLRYSYRLTELEELKTALNILKSKIKFKYIKNILKCNKQNENRKC